MKPTTLAFALTLLSAPVAHAMDGSQMQSYFDANIAPWMGSQVLVDAIVAQNAVTGGYDAAQIDALDQTWRAEVGSGSTPTIDAVLNNAAADFLRDQVAAAGGAITEVFIMDGQGLNVAASGVTSDYWQGDEAKFQET